LTSPSGPHIDRRPLDGALETSLFDEGDQAVFDKFIGIQTGPLFQGFWSAAAEELVRKVMLCRRVEALRQNSPERQIPGSGQGAMARPSTTRTKRLVRRLSGLGDDVSL
jgi:hypothetical protein